MECEISFRLTRDLPARDERLIPKQEVFDALEGCAAFELVDSRFRDLKSAMEKTPYEFYADHIANGAMVFGAFRKDWQKFDFTKTRVTMKQGGKDHHRQDRRPSDRQSGQARGGAGEPSPYGTTGLKAGTLHRDRLVHRLSPGRARSAGHRRIRRLRYDGSDDRRLTASIHARRISSVMPGLTRHPSISASRCARALGAIWTAGQPRR